MVRPSRTSIWRTDVAKLLRVEQCIKRMNANRGFAICFSHSVPPKNAIMIDITTIAPATIRNLLLFVISCKSDLGHKNVLDLEGGLPRVLRTERRKHCDE